MKSGTTFKGAPKPYGASGHFDEPRRHSLQAKGFKTGTHSEHPLDFMGAPLPRPRKEIIPKSNLPIWEGELSEQTLNLIRRRMNDGKLKEQEIPFPDDASGILLTQEQVEKGRAWLIDQWKSPRGVERKNNPFGFREQEILEKFETIKLHGFYDTSRYGGRPFYVPIYSVEGDNNSFEYYVSGGEISIIG